MHDRIVYAAFGLVITTTVIAVIVYCEDDYLSDSDGAFIEDEYSGGLDCSEENDCTKLLYPCVTCTIQYPCVYGDEYDVTCIVDRNYSKCQKPENFTRKAICQFCYQTDPVEYECIEKTDCPSVSSPPHYYTTNCTVYDDVICLGNRQFSKNLKCNWSGGYSWWKALTLSITLGGFGADRFYLGHWQEGIGKLFSFGGLGIWTFIDVVLIATGYLGPADGSLYV